MTATKDSDFSMSLDNLEGTSWGEPEYDSYVVRTIHALRRKPLGDLSNEELRLAISQRVGVPFVLDLAFSRLQSNPLLSGDFYKGDVLALLVQAEPNIWKDRPGLRAQLPWLVKDALHLSYEEDFFGEAFREAVGAPVGERGRH